ncbi:MAG: transglutaminase family protein [Sphingomonadales bacterium]|nr:transglutaminase family protein [Sphingomonadales bacterium]MDE2170076.1 transglutaminase family protein [Sphingomonadales bacterium]
MIYRVRHTTRLFYSNLVRLARFNLRLHPVEWPGQSLCDYRLDVSPKPARIRQTTGPWLVNETHLAMREPLARLDITSSFRVEVKPPRHDIATLAGPSIAQLRREALAFPSVSPVSPAPYMFASPIARIWPEEIGAWGRQWLHDEAPVVQASLALMMAIHQEFAFDATSTRPDLPPIDAFRARRGVCQDFTHVMICAARAMGLPAAYVSGYLRTNPPPGMPRLIGADMMHAWVGIWCGAELGWLGFDPTNARLAATDHIVIAMGRDYGDVAPLDGVFHGGSGQTMTVSADVVPVEEEGEAEDISLTG